MKIEKPIFLNPAKTEDNKIINSYKKKANCLIDLSNHFNIEFEDLRKLKKINLAKQVSYHWVWFDWNKQLVKIPFLKEWRQIRLSRNRELINTEEQEKFSQVKVGIVGMNVGYHAAVSLALEGGASYMKFADYDILTPSTLNRFRAGLSDIGCNKCVVSARQVYEIDPYYKLKIYSQGISKNNINNFLQRPKIDILIEEMDNLYLKIAIRQQAKKMRLPVIMVTGNGSNLILDVERYDKDSSLNILNSYPKKSALKKIITSKSEDLSLAEKKDLARDFMNTSKLSKRLEYSFEKVGLSLPAVPQLAETSFLRGAVLTYVVRKIALGEKLLSGRYYLEMEKMFK